MTLYTLGVFAGSLGTFIGILVANKVVYGHWNTMPGSIPMTCGETVMGRASNIAERLSTHYKYVKTHGVTAYQWFPGLPIQNAEHLKRIETVQGTDRHRFKMCGYCDPLCPGDWIVHDHDGGYTHVVPDEEFKKTFQPAE